MCNTYDALIIIKNHVLIECCKCESETEWNIINSIW